MKRLDGKIALITGAASGQGAAEARLFAAEGATVVVTDINELDGAAVAASIEGGLFRALDVSDYQAWERVAAEVESRFGRLDVLVNNAGIPPGDGVVRFDKISLEAHHRLMDVNFHGVYYGMRVMLPLLERSGDASVVNISSIDGLVGVLGMASYTASKFAVTGLTRSAAIELGPLGIRVNSIHPGIIASPMVTSVPAEMRGRLDTILSRQPLPRVGTPEEVAKLALFLASSDSSYCTGSQFTVDGGHLAGPYRDPLP